MEGAASASPRGPAPAPGGRVARLVGHAHGRVLAIGRLADLGEALAERPQVTYLRLEERAAGASSLPTGTELPKAAFDAVLLDEVLEHVFDPEDLLKTIERAAVPGAPVAIAARLGYNPHPHKSTFFVASLLELLATHVDVAALEIEGYHLEASGRLGNTSDARRLALIERLQPRLEARMLEAQIEGLRMKDLAERRRARTRQLRRRARRERRRAQRAQRAARKLRRRRWAGLGRLPGAIRGRRERPRARAHEGASTEGTADPGAEPGEATTARPEVTAAVILDPEMRRAFGSEWRQLELTRDGWRRELGDRPPPQLLFAQALGPGDGSGWDLSAGGRDLEPLGEVVSWCRERGVPTVFWGTRDPGGFEDFLAAARLFDYAFTVDRDSLRRYRETLGGERSGLLPFFAQPRLDNPIARGHGRTDVRVALDATGSPGVCPRSLYELSARGIVAVADGSPAVTDAFGALLPTAAGPEAAQAEAERLAADPDLRDRTAHRALRAVLDAHTCAHRVDDVLEAAGIQAARRRPAVSVLTATIRAGFVRHVIDQVAKQRWRPLQFVLVLHGVDMEPQAVAAQARSAGIEDVVVLSREESVSLGECMNVAAAAADGDLLQRMDDDDLYGPEFVGDLVRASTYADAEVIGKLAQYVHLERSGATMLRYPSAEHSYVESVHGGTMMFRAEVMRELGWESSTVRADTALLRDVRAHGGRIYGADRFSFVYMRRARGHAHAWAISDGTVMRSSTSISYEPPERYLEA